MPIQWERMMVEFDQMKEVDQLRAVTKEQMEWLTEVAQSVPSKDALDLGFGCGFSAVAMVRGGCSVTCVNNEPANVPRRIEAEQRYERMCGQPPTIIEASTDRALPRLRDEGRKFGLIFVDAGHRVDDVFIDVHYAKGLCVPGWDSGARRYLLWRDQNGCQLGHFESWTRLEAVSDSRKYDLVETDRARGR
jgi:hypothetical protein